MTPAPSVIDRAMPNGASTNTVSCTVLRSRAAPPSRPLALADVLDEPNPSGASKQFVHLHGPIEDCLSP